MTSTAGVDAEVMRLAENAVSLEMTSRFAVPLTWATISSTEPALSPPRVGMPADAAAGPPAA